MQGVYFKKTIAMLIEFLFWLSFLMVAYTYFFYSAILFIWSLLHSKKQIKNEIFPRISIIISVYNEEGYIEDKIRNLLKSDYPEDKIEILVGSDGSTDSTNEIMKRLSGQKIKAFTWTIRRGKVNVINELVREASGDILLFTDARQIFDKKAIKELTGRFADPEIGCVSGELILKDDNQSTAGAGVGLYWNYEKLLRRLESETGSMIGATGAIYAIRKELFMPPYKDVILDDVFIPLSVVKQGYRSVFEKEALAFDYIVKSPEQEFKRKIRTLAGNWQITFYMKDMLNPLRSKVAFQLISHKLLRLLIPYVLVILFVSNFFILNGVFYQIFLIMQVIFFVLAMLGFFFSKYKIKLFNIPFTFCYLNFAATVGLFRFITKKQSVIWEKNNSQPSIF